MRFGGVIAVDHASIDVESGRIAALIGPNGAGKTTTFNIISGLQEPTSGQVFWKGEDVTSFAVQARARRGIGRTFQRLEVFGSLTVYENLLVSAEIHRSWNNDAPQPRLVAEELIDLIGLEDFRHQPADSIPTGMARRTELGRALAIDPELLLLDEPASGQDEEETAEFGDLLRELARRGKSILMVEHDVELVMDVCEWIDVLDFGRIIASGRPEEIQANDEVQAAYLGAEVAVEEAGV
ncbi:MAG: ABC transporter ATP-binding protein [Actinobacteria bacterium]|nr:ABC transporter ATP-binding protein [Actinomycetota bacterium]